MSHPFHLESTAVDLGPLSVEARGDYWRNLARELADALVLARAELTPGAGDFLKLEAARGAADAALAKAGRLR